MALIALDWGSTRLRGWLLGDRGAVLAERSSDRGASVLDGSPAAFDAALRALADDWLDGRPPMLACGMVGSAHGWREAAYVPCPAELEALHTHLVAVDTRCGGPLHIVPGLIDAPADLPPDVMRGEETQLAGLAMTTADATVLLPGTHSKWVALRQGRVGRFRTRMTGELYALLRRHSVLGRLMPPGDGAEDAAAFAAGVAEARRGDGGDLAGQLFAVRTLGLTARLPVTALADHLSGLLIGHELVAGLRDDSAPLVLVGEPDLCARYGRAAALLGRPPAAVHANTAAAGLWRLALLAGLVQPR